MRLFVVDVNKDGAAVGQYMTVTDFAQRLEHARNAKREHEEDTALDQALFAVIDIAHVGMVIPFRLGWVFIAEDASR